MIGWHADGGHERLELELVALLVARAVQGAFVELLLWIMSAPSHGVGDRHRPAVTPRWPMACMARTRPQTCAR